MGLLDGKVAFITGGASGIGEGAALRFAREGAKVAIADTRPDDGESVCRRIVDAGGDAVFFVCDVRNPASVERAVALTFDRWGRLDIVFANAGINGVWAPIQEITPDEWDETLEVNLKGTFLTVRSSVPRLIASGGGSILVTSSINGNRTFSSAGATAYSCSKAAQVALVKMAALELGRHGIRVNAICPGAIHTKIGESTKKRDTRPIEHDAADTSEVLNAGQGEPADVADVCLFLASDLSRHVSGVELYVDGGASLLR